MINYFILSELLKKDFISFNKLNDTDEIIEHLREGAARFEIAIHYKNPYPRPVYVELITI